MKFLKNLWTWFSGRKTQIGTFGMAFLGLPLNFLKDVPTDIITIAYWIFAGLAAGGLLHKGGKFLKKRSEKKQKK